MYAKGARLALRAFSCLQRGFLVLKYLVPVNKTDKKTDNGEEYV